jgi:ubiquinone/menaquinone biosynthesis C-methylase UbiE
MTSRTVQAGYDALAPRFADWMAGFKGEPSDRFLARLAARLEDGAKVLDLGCGDGTRTQCLTERFAVVGVDISEEQLRLARAAAPEATFIQADFAKLDLPDESYDAITALYSFMHVPRAEHPALFEKILRWLKPGGLFLASLSHVGGPDRTEEWLGVEMFFSGFDAETNARLLRDAGFELLLDEVVWTRAPEGETAFLWVLGQKPSSRIGGPAGARRDPERRLL